MASSDDRDKDTKDSQPKNDNPFIKFRQFADSQISSLLQGIVGLPSAFSKRPDNARWDDFDEDMRRRDELQKRQKELRDSEARKQNEGQGAQGWPSWVDSTAEVHTDDEQMDDRIAREIPLYSPVSRALFSHLRYAKEDTGPKDDWKHIDERHPYPFSLLSSIHDGPGRFRNYVEHMGALQNTVYRDLQNNPILRSDYSLLPYMLFSPYSPIKLESEAAFRDFSGQQAPDQFAYLDAFSDLMLITQGRQMDNIPFEYIEKLPVIEPERGYLLTLWAHGVLQQRSTTKYRDVIEFQRMLTGDLRSWAATAILNQEDPEDAETELEAYERFLVRAFQFAAGDPIESFFTYFHDWVKQRLGSLDPTEMKRQLEELMDFLEQNSGNEEEDERRAKAVKALGSLLVQAAGQGNAQTTEERKRVAESFSETKIGKELEEVKRKAAADPEKVVSTSTTTERTKNLDGSVENKVEVWKHYADGEEVEATCTTTEHTIDEDGSVETRVEVWKRYADGRVTTTTTSHVEERRYDDDDDNDHSNNEGRQQEMNAEKVDEKKEEKKQEKQKGWFWN